MTEAVQLRIFDNLNLRRELQVDDISAKFTAKSTKCYESSKTGFK